MKVTFCAYDTPNRVGGPNAWLRRLLPELHHRGLRPQVLFITIYGTPEECPNVRSLRSQGFDCPATSWLHFTERHVQWILYKIAEDPPDIFVPNLMVPAFYAGRWVRQAGIPTVGVLHSDDPFYWGLVSEFVCGDNPYRLSGLACVSKFLEREVLKQDPDGVVVERLPYGAPLPQSEVQRPSGQLRLVYAGRLVDEQKRISDLIRSLCRAVREVADVEAVVYGDGPAKEAAEQIIDLEGQGLPVRLAGRVDSDQIQKHLLKCHALVLLSDYEGLPIVLMEAMACGVVPICLRTRSGISELVEDGVTGLLVDDRGDDFIAAVRRLRDDPGLWERLSKAARTRIETEYSNEVCAARWKDFLRRLNHNAGPQQSLKIPGQLDLPHVHPSLAREDFRKAPLHVRLGQLSSRLVKHARDSLLGK